MLKTMRSASSSWAFKLLLILLVLSFALWGVGDMLGAAGSNRSVATVGDMEISVETYQAALQREQEMIRRSLGDQYTPEIAKAFNPERRTLRQLLRRSLIAQESEALGIIPSDGDVVKRIRSDPHFQDDHGQFDKTRLAAALRSAYMNEKDYIERLRQELAANLIMSVLSVSIPVPDKAVETIHASQEEQRQATLYRLNESLAGPLPTPPEGALETYFSAHEQEFVAPESRKISYAIIDPADAVRNVKVTEDTLLAAYKDRIDEFRLPEQRTVDQLLFSNERDAKLASEALAEDKSFDEVARTAAILNKNSVSLGDVQKEQLPDIAAEEIFTMTEGAVTKPVESPFGWHIFHLRAIKPPSTAPLNDVRKQLEEEVKHHLQQKAQTEYLHAIEDMLAGGATLQEAAKEFEFTVNTVGPIVRAGETPGGEKVKLPELDKFLETAFSSPEGVESPLIHSDAKFYIVRVESVTPERVRSLDEVRGLVTAAWQNASRRERLEKIATELAEKMKDPNERKNALAKLGLSPAWTGELKRSAKEAGKIDVTPTLVADIFQNKPGESTKAHPLPSGGYAIAVSGNYIPAGKADAKSASAIRTALADSMEQEIQEAYLRYLEHKYPVTLNEALLQSINSQSE